MTQTSDTLIILCVLIAAQIGAMRAFYGAWPWEKNKTWYVTRLTVEWVQKLYDAKLDEVENYQPGERAVWPQKVASETYIKGDDVAEGFKQPLREGDSLVMHAEPLRGSIVGNPDSFEPTDTFDRQPDPDSPPALRPAGSSG